jgi:adenylate kinase
MKNNIGIEEDKPLIIFVGLPGSGKSTQASLLSRACAFPCISAGHLLREIAANVATQMREPVASLLLTGSFMPDELLMSTVIPPLEAAYKASKGIILDGMPRKLSQAKLLDASLKELGVYTIKAVYLSISPDQARERVAQRLICKNCQAPGGYPGGRTRCDFCEDELIRRVDDISNLMDTRWREYFRQTEPLIQAYEEEDKLVTINGEQPIHIVFAEIIKAVNSLIFHS